MDNPVRVMHLISSLGIGGAERLLIDTLVATGARANGPVRYVAVVMNDAVNTGLRAELEASGAPVYCLGRREGHVSPRYIRQLLAIIDRHGIEVIHTHNEGSRTWGMLAKLLRPRLKLVYTIHSHDNAASITGLKRLAYRLVDASVAISDFVAETAHCLKPRNLTLVRNGIALDRLRQLPRQPGGDRPFHIVNVARFIEFKGQDVLIEALARCMRAGADMRVTLLGTIADRAYYEGLHDKVRQHGLEDRVSFVLDRADIETFLASADVFVLPSRSEGFGIAVVEAMAAGLPVVVAKVGGAAEIVVDGVSGLHFTAGDANELADRLMRLAGDGALRAALSQAGAKRAGDYDIGVMAEALAGLYGRLTGRAASGAQGVATMARTETPMSDSPAA